MGVCWEIFMKPLGANTRLLSFIVFSPAALRANVVVHEICSENYTLLNFMWHIYHLGVPCFSLRFAILQKIYRSSAQWRRGKGTNWYFMPIIIELTLQVLLLNEQKTWPRSKKSCWGYFPSMNVHNVLPGLPRILTKLLLTYDEKQNSITSTKKMLRGIDIKTSFHTFFAVESGGLNVIEIGIYRKEFFSNDVRLHKATWLSPDFIFMQSSWLNRLSEKCFSIFFSVVSDCSLQMNVWWGVSRRELKAECKNILSKSFSSC